MGIFCVFILEQLFNSSDTTKNVSRQKNLLDICVFGAFGE